jgi:hypothetical protein
MATSRRQSCPFSALGAALLVLAVVPASASADDLRFSYAPLQPVVGSPMQFTAIAYDPSADPMQIDVFIRPNADGTCGDTMAQEAARGSTHLFSESLTPLMASAYPSSFTATFTPTIAGDYTACGYDNFSAHPDRSAEYTAEFVVTQPSGTNNQSGTSRQTCVVPRLLGKRLAAAKLALRDAHCGVGTVSTRKGKRSAKGRVVSQSPGAGSHRAADAKVRLTIGR